MSDKIAKVNLLASIRISEAIRIVFISCRFKLHFSKCQEYVALFELMLKRGWPSLAETLLTLSKAVDRRLWIHHSPLRQFENILKPETIYKLEEKDATVDR